MRYHIGRDGQRYGPFSDAELREQLARGDVLASDSIWHEGLPAWQPVASLFPDAPRVPPPPPSVSGAHDQAIPGANTGFVLGLINLITWFIPIVGLPLSIWGLVASIKAQRRGVGGKAIAGLVLNIIALVLTVVNAAIGAYLGATGQHPLFK